MSKKWLFVGLIVGFVIASILTSIYGYYAVLDVLRNVCSFATYTDGGIEACVHVTSGGIYG